jgi:hypothetical protein
LAQSTICRKARTKGEGILLSPVLTKRHLMNDPVKTKFNYDHSTDNVILESVQDVAPLLELNKKELNNDSMYGTQSSNGMRKVASIPLVVIEKWKRELGIDIYNKNDWPKIKQLLNDPENRFLRTHESQL